MTPLDKMSAALALSQSGEDARSSVWRYALDPATNKQMQGFDPNGYYQFRNGDGLGWQHMMRFADFSPYANVWCLQYRDPLADVQPPSGEN